MQAVGRKVVTRWVQQSLALAWTSWSSSAHDAKKQRVLTKKILKHWTNARLARAWETWSGLRSENIRLTKAAIMVLSRWTKKALVACWNAWLAHAPAKKRLKAAAMRVVTRWVQGSMTHAWATWSSSADDAKRMKAATMKVIKRWTQQCLVVSLNSWSSTVREEKRMRNVLQKVLARWSRSYLSEALETWSLYVSETVRMQAVGRKVVARLQGSATAAAFMRWRGKAGEEKKARQVAQKVVLRWESASKMKAFMRWEDAVEEAREQMAKLAEQASKEHDLIHKLQAVDAANKAASVRMLQDLSDSVQDLKHAMKFKTADLDKKASSLVGLSVEFSSQFNTVTRDRQRASLFAAEIQKIQEDANNKKLEFFRQISHTMLVGKWWQKRLANVFNILKQLARAELRLRVLSSKATTRRAKLTMSNVWGGWHFVWCERKRSNYQLGNGVRRWKRLILWKVVDTWQYHAAERVRLGQSSSKMLKHWHCKVGPFVFLIQPFPPYKVTIKLTNNDNNRGDLSAAQSLLSKVLAFLGICLKQMLQTSCLLIICSSLQTLILAFKSWSTRTRKWLARERSALKVVTRWVQQSLALAWTTWSSSAHVAKKQRVLTKKILKHWTNARLARAWETWSGLRSKNIRLTKAAIMVLSRWTKRALVACWNAWLAHAPAKKRLKAAAMKVIKRWTQQCLIVAWNTWSSTVREEKRMRNVLARFQGSATAAAFMRWRGKAGEEKKARQVAQKVVLRWESASKMKAFMRWEGAVEEAREQMAKLAEQASKDALAEDVTKVTAELSKQVQQRYELEATHTKKIMEAAHLRGKLQDVEKRADVIQQELNCLVNETQAQKSAVLKLSGDKISELGKQLHGLKTVLEHERESRRSAEEQAQKLVSTMQLNLE
jgi:hypothetical protein